MKIFTKLLLMSILSILLAACTGAKPEKFASDAPIKKIIFDAPFPADLIYQATPDAKVIVGKKRSEAVIYEISGFAVETGKKLWQLPFTGEIVGQTEKQLIVYEEKTLTAYFITPQTGEITRKVAPAPNPLASRNGFEYGMAFNDDVYLTTKSLYTTVWENAADWKNRTEDQSFPIGITAKTWANNEKVWFVPPVQQIVTIETRPVIFGDKVLIINPPETVNGNQTYQIVALKTGAEIFRGKSDGRFYLVGANYFIERTDSFVRRIEPVTNRELWKIEGNFHNASVAAIADQITFNSPDGTQTATLRVADAETGKLRTQFELPYTKTALKFCLVTKDGIVLINFDSALYDIYDQQRYNYLVAYNAETGKVLWRTDYESHSASSLIPFAADKVRFE